ncbi:nitrilase-related carbon-nitrogen hydrolase [Streptomyces sp. M19]
MPCHRGPSRVRLLAYPELHLCGHGPGEDPGVVMAAAAEPLDGPRGARLAALARELGIWLVPGSVYELGADGRVYNTAPVYSPAGERVAGTARSSRGGPMRPRRPAAASWSSTWRVTGAWG